MSWKTQISKKGAYFCNLSAKKQPFPVFETRLVISIKNWIWRSVTFHCITPSPHKKILQNKADRSSPYHICASLSHHHPLSYLTSLGTMLPLKTCHVNVVQGASKVPLQFVVWITQPKFNRLSWNLVVMLSISCHFFQKKHLSNLVIWLMRNDPTKTTPDFDCNACDLYGKLQSQKKLFEYPLKFFWMTVLQLRWFWWNFADEILRWK